MTTRHLEEDRPRSSRASAISRESAAHLIDRRVRAGAVMYDRDRHLPALIRIEPWAAVGETRPAVEAILARLERALRAERNRARSGHWTYDLNRHIALRQAHRAESERLAELKAGRV